MDEYTISRSSSIKTEVFQDHELAISRVSMMKRKVGQRFRLLQESIYLSIEQRSLHVICPLTQDCLIRVRDRWR